MDLSAFAQDKFDVKEWVNMTFRQPDALSNPENYASSLVMKLQLCIHEINSSLENTSSMVVQSLPRLLRDVESLQLEVSQFHSKVKKVEEELEQIEKGTGTSTDQLVKLETLKTRMLATSKALREADNWTTLMADIEDLFESADLLVLARRLSALRHSLTLLTHVSDYQERIEQLEGLRNRLEALASPRLFTALSSGDTDSTKIMAEVFSSMDRLPQLLNYYSKCRRGVLLQSWSTLVVTSNETSLLDLLPTFYDKIQTDYHDQLKWASQIFPNQPIAKILINVYTEVLNALEPKPVIGSETLQRRGLACFSPIKSSMDRFVVTMETTGVKDDLVNFAPAVYQPFRLLLSSKYSNVLQQQLVQILPNLKTGSKDQLENSVQLLRNSISRIANEINAVISGCCDLTNGAGLYLMIKAVSEFLIRHLLQYRSLLGLAKNVTSGEELQMLHSYLLLLQTLGESLTMIGDSSAAISATVQSYSRKLTDPPTLLTNYVELYLEPANQNQLLQLFDSQSKKTGNNALEAVFSLAKEINVEVQQSVYDVMFDPIQKQLAIFGKPDWLSTVTGSLVAGEIPDFGVAPLEYITQIGQYLMLLPQHLEPFVLQENSGLTRSLAERVFPFCEGIETPLDDVSTAADFLLGCLGKGTCTALMEAVLRIPTMNATAAKQVSADIDYLGNILEDLGFTLSPNTSHLRDLLRAAAAAMSSSNMSQYRSFCDGKPARLVAAVRNMCNLPSSD